MYAALVLTFFWTTTSIAWADGEAERRLAGPERFDQQAPARSMDQMRKEQAPSPMPQAPERQKQKCPLIGSSQTWPHSAIVSCEHQF